MFLVILFCFMTIALILEKILGRTMAVIIVRSMTASFFGFVVWFLHGMLGYSVWPGDPWAFVGGFVATYLLLILMDSAIKIIFWAWKGSFK